MSSFFLRYLTFFPLYFILISCGAETLGNNENVGLSVDIDNITFSETFIGELSSSQKLSIVNRSGKVVSVSQLRLSDGFLRDPDNTTCASGPIRFTPNMSCELAVRFSPDRRDNITGTLRSITDNTSKNLARFVGYGRNNLPLETDTSDGIYYWNVPDGGKKTRYIKIKNSVEDMFGNTQDIFLEFSSPLNSSSSVNFVVDAESTSCISGKILGYGESCIIAVTANASAHNSSEQSGIFIVTTDSKEYEYTLKAKTTPANTATIFQYPKSRTGAGISVVGTKLYLYGGVKDDKTFEGSLWSFDLPNGAWKLLNNDSTNPKISNFKPLVIGSDIKIFGGMLSDHSANSSMVTITPSTATVVTTTNMTNYKAIDYAIALTSASEIFALGGYDNITGSPATKYATILQNLRKIDGTTGIVTTIPDNLTDPATIFTPTGKIGGSMSAITIGSNKYLYHFGGYEYSSTDDTLTYNDDKLWRYSFDNDSWWAMAKSGTLPSKRSHVKMENINNILYLFGGENGGTVYDDLYTITPSDTGTQNFVKITSPTFNGTTIKVKNPAVTSGGNNIYIYGGVNMNVSPNRPSDTLYIYNTASKVVTSTNLQIPFQLREHTLGSYLDNKSVLHLYAIGGKDNLIDRSGNIFFSYNTVTGLYANLATHNPQLADNSTFTQLGEYMYLANSKGMQRYSPKDGSWQDMANQILNTDTGYGRTFHDAVHFRYKDIEAIYIFGGVVSGAYSDKMDIITPNKSAGDILIKTSASSVKPQARANHSMVQVDDRIYLYGGNNGSTVYSDLWEFQVLPTGDGVWSKIGDMASKGFPLRKNHKLMMNAGRTKFYIIGGNNGTIDVTGITAITYDKLTPTNATISTPPTLVGDSIVLTGTMNIENVDGTAIGVEDNRLFIINF